MEKRVFETPSGEAWVWGDAFDGSKPAVLAIHGAFEDAADRFFDLQKALPVRVFAARLPGQGCPHLSEPSLEATAAAYDAVAAKLDAQLVCGESAGGLVALAMRGPWSTLVLDPPLISSRLWSAEAYLRRRIAEDPAQAPLMWSLLGIGPDRTEARDWTGLLRAGVMMMVGAEAAYPERTFETPPSVVGDPERRKAIEAGVELAVVPEAGHVIPKAAPGRFLWAVARMLGARSGADHADASAGGDLGDSCG